MQKQDERNGHADDVGGVDDVQFSRARLGGSVIWLGGVTGHCMAWRRASPGGCFCEGFSAGCGRLKRTSVPGLAGLTI
jgi:hypothetical protein